MNRFLPFILVLIFVLVFGSYYFFRDDKDSTPATNPNNSESEEAIDLPMKDGLERITKKPFGKFVTPENSPVSPERFRGFHTGTDFEAKEEELNMPLPVNAICEGEIVRKQAVNGYGGVIIQNCVIEKQRVTVLYGHLDISDPRAKLLGTNIKKGEFLANLAANNSEQSGRERKHLHLGIHKGTEIEYRGYVQNEAELVDWLDFEKLI